MPVRSLHSAVLKWPDREETLRKVKSWAAKTGSKNRNIKRIYCYGSITGERWGVGSDCDIMVEIDSSKQSFMERIVAGSPSVGVDVEIVTYATEELQKMREQKRRFTDVIDNDALLVYERK